MVRTAIALARSSHPGPAIAVTVVAVLLAAGVGATGGRVALVGAVMLLDQVSVGLANDWIDAPRDAAVGRTDKPVARGEVSRRLAAGWAFGTAAASVLLSVPLGAAFVAVHAIVLLSAWGYDLGLKRTPASVLPFVVSFGLLPSLATTALTPPQLAPAWAFVAGASLGIAAHVANVLPDLAADAATGVRGMPHRIGRRTSIVVIAVATIAGAAAVALGARGPALVLGGPAALIGVAILVLGLRRPPTRALFRLVIAAAIVDVSLLVLSGGALVR
ncbi:UbiA family prenyltransferase [Galbitalea sp. SE-J8]|uniref:UbiA family prenyltransferase n=1 Tax=Galbitalea sp. SE-J8 TaxID=3054952 RepID=UPI00259D2119|nr:UbiA family prenyltransferase [Galbitalea sp. SE-J8]MDM4761782.1 UbiA family prenyltransferase [Galbitalea sp. SE-J8]